MCKSWLLLLRSCLIHAMCLGAQQISIKAMKLPCDGCIQLQLAFCARSYTSSSQIDSLDG